MRIPDKQIKTMIAIEITDLFEIIPNLQANICLASINAAVERDAFLLVSLALPPAIIIRPPIH